LQANRPIEFRFQVTARLVASEAPRGFDHDASVFELTFEGLALSA
jgi:hypothetical protein